ncbi:MAG TPA: METTL5 family protein [Methanothrix sp.]|nr:METTL5 family protein [Methanothrix sp.]HPT18614.1 METTL5 family protein [Methanothrix sp.]
MKKKQLEMMLERLEGFSRPSFQREQYSTPAVVAAEMLFLAALRGDLEGCTVCDLGCGTGILAIGAALMGARSVGVEIDPQALETAKRNAGRAGVSLQLLRADVGALELRGIDTVIMNPPFGAQKSSEGDRAFLSRALQTAKVVYSLHNRGSAGFIRGFVKPAVVEELYCISYPLKKCFDFHSSSVRMIEVELYRIVRDSR